MESALLPVATTATPFPLLLPFQPGADDFGPCQSKKLTRSPPAPSIHLSDLKRPLSLLSNQFQPPPLPPPCALPVLLEQQAKWELWEEKKKRENSLHVCTGRNVNPNLQCRIKHRAEGWGSVLACQCCCVITVNNKQLGVWKGGERWEEYGEHLAGSCPSLPFLCGLVTLFFQNRSPPPLYPLSLLAYGNKLQHLSALLLAL